MSGDAVNDPAGEVALGEGARIRTDPFSDSSHAVDNEHPQTGEVDRPPDPVAEPVGAGTVAHGPTPSDVAQRGPFNARQLARIDEALTLSSRETGITFSLYVGELAQPSRGTAEKLFGQLTGLREPVLVAVSPGQRVLHIVTGEESAQRLPNRSCALAALGMRASFTNGDLTGGIVNGLRMLADSAGQRR